MIQRPEASAANIIPSGSTVNLMSRPPINPNAKRWGRSPANRSGINPQTKMARVTAVTSVIVSRKFSCIRPASKIKNVAVKGTARIQAITIVSLVSFIAGHPLKFPRRLQQDSMAHLASRQIQHLTQPLVMSHRPLAGVLHLGLPCCLVECCLVVLGF
jgi:hypothetical protein